MYGIIPQLEKHNIRKLLFKDYRILYQIDENKELIMLSLIINSIKLFEYSNLIRNNIKTL